MSDMPQIQGFLRESLYNDAEGHMDTVLREFNYEMSAALLFTGAKLSTKLKLFLIY